MMLDIRDEIVVFLIILSGYPPSALVLDVFLPADLLPSLVWPVLPRSTEEDRGIGVRALVINAREAAVGRHWL